MSFLFPRLWEKLFGKFKKSSPKRPRTVKPELEVLEELVLLSTFTYVGPPNGTWSNVADWRVLHFDPNNGTPSWDKATNAPGANDDVWLTPPPAPPVPPGQPALASVTALANSVVDAVAAPGQTGEHRFEGRHH